MLLDEPPRSQGDLIFSIAGIPVRVHPMFWLVALLLGLGATGGKPIPIAIWVAAAFVSILVHELGHALVARSYGFEPRITLHAMGGLASYLPARREPKSNIAITLAGPAAGFLFAMLVILALRASGRQVELTWSVSPLVQIYFDRFDNLNLHQFVFYLLYVNIYWGLLNLLPVYPLDGGQIARDLLTLADPGEGLRRSLWLSVLVAGGIAVYSLAQGSMYLGMMFAYLGYQSYTALQSYFGSGGGRR